MCDSEQNGSLSILHLQPEEYGGAGDVPDSPQHGVRRQRVHRWHFQNRVSAGQNQSSNLGWDGDGSPRRAGFVLLSEEESNPCYSSFTLNYGEEEELSSAPVHVIHTRFVLSKVVKGANIAMLAASICSAFFVLAMAYLGCRSLPRCACYDSVTGMEWLQPTEDQNQAVEMVCAVQSPGGRIFNFPDRFPAQDVDAEEDTSKPPPYIRLT
ncbi:uncharacterized protein LOC113975136 isoform X2 [Neopelma chrysocephalum]|uniref:uncharacterized protein LOC113975136 isoform X2 n=1 Tax=Neopelma chrysocephalum TaxID=114329 RepID=UPI000FCD0A58|nr:uncharacterized protein LOC113975136 isoform X2 [Neopelma chrysocephalum]XP_027554669.1 uncharacterized protein LOC113975136 isoform X2 [Neopelma chrysocephalum]XP_027554670.1 uncharacterized protein LOC113975136 isoform X2 [Neopelma chrysocephalum]